MTSIRVGTLEALAETASTLRDMERWWTLAWTDTKLRYRRTVLGPWWVTLSSGAIIGSIGLVWGGIFGTDLRTYLPYFAAGFIVWALISATMLEGSSVFSASAGMIKSSTTPLMVHVFRMLARQFIVLIHNAIIVVVVWLIFRWPIDWGALLVLPGLLILAVALFGITLTLGVLCTRFRDVLQIVGAVLQLLFLLTPIAWFPENLRGKPTEFLIDINPFYDLIEILREPVLGKPLNPSIWAIAVLSALISAAIGLALYGRLHYRIAYWL